MVVILLLHFDLKVAQLSVAKFTLKKEMIDSYIETSRIYFKKTIIPVNQLDTDIFEFQPVCATFNDKQNNTRTDLLWTEM